MKHSLDLRGTVCPINFIKTKLLLDKLASGAVVEVILDAGEAIDSVYASVLAEGHSVEKEQLPNSGAFCLIIRRA